MRRRLLIVAVLPVFALAAAQVLIPPIGESKVESRLTAGGGAAEVTLSALPAVRLLFAEGERIEVEASDLELGLEPPSEPAPVEPEAESEPEQPSPVSGPAMRRPSSGVFDQLDGFTTVDISIADSAAGPVALESFTLTRHGEGPYRIVSRGTASPTALARYGLGGYVLPGEGVVDVLLSPLLDSFVPPVPVDIDLELVSDDDGVRVVAGQGRIAGVPVARLTDMIAAAIVDL